MRISDWSSDVCSSDLLVALSTDYVFDGTKAEPYQEWDEPNPQSVYGRSKLAGERAALAHAPGCAIVRTAWVCGAHGHNMVRSEEHTSELQSLMRISYAVFCLKKKHMKNKKDHTKNKI